MEQIRLERQLQALRRKLVLYAAGLVSSLASFVVVIQDFYLQAHQSGFLDFSSLILSDFHLVLGHFYDYLLSLAESLPTVSFMFACLALLVFIASGIKMISSGIEFRKLRTH